MKNYTLYKNKKHNNSIMVILAFFVVLFNSSLLAVTVNSAGSTAWSVGGTWSSGASPTSSQDVNVSASHSITLDANLSITTGVWVFNGTVTDAPGATAYTMEMKNTSSLTISANTTFGGNLSIKNTAALTVNGPAGTTLTVGAFEIENSATLYVAANCTLVVNGTFNSKNSAAITLDGAMLVNGSATMKNTSAIISSPSVSTGYFSSTGNTTFNNSASIFTSTTGCGSPLCVYRPPAALPIELLSFTITKKENDILIQWVTATEINNDFFLIERSANGISFEGLTKVTGAGNSTSKKEYSFVDDKPIEGNSYYRLMQVDYDGQSVTFDMLSVYYEKLPGGGCVLKVFPNPCVGQCTVALEDCNNEENPDIEVELLDAGGNKVYSKIPSRDDKGSFTFQIDTQNNLAPGVYIVRGASKKESYMQKMIVR